MKKVLAVSVLAILVLGLAAPSFAERKTREYTPIVKTKNVSAAGTERVWTLHGSPYSNIVCDSYTISADAEQVVTLAASNTIVVLHVSASQPVVSPGNFIIKVPKDEEINITTTGNKVDVTLSGWEEN